MKRVLAMLLCVGMLASLVGCGKTAEPSGEQENTAEAEEAAEPAETEEPATAESSEGEKLVIGCTFMKNAPFMEPLAAGMQAYCDEKGYEFIAYYADNDISLQISQCEDLIAQGVDGLIVMPVDAAGIKPGLEAAAAAGIPACSVDADVEDQELVIGYVASNNYLAGQLAGEDVVKRHPDGCNVVVLSHPEILCTQEREAGFLDALKEAGEDKYPIVSTQPCKGLQDQAMTVMENMVQAYEFEVAFCINDPSAQAAANVLKSAGLIDKVDVYGVDGEQASADYIKEGMMRGDSAQQPYQMGYLACEKLDKHLQGEEVEYETLLDIQFITEENADEYSGF